MILKNASKVLFAAVLMNTTVMVQDSDSNFLEDSVGYSSTPKSLDSGWYWGISSAKADYDCFFACDDETDDDAYEEGRYYRCLERADNKRATCEATAQTPAEMQMCAATWHSEYYSC